jgi:hypothetical protein
MMIYLQKVMLDTILHYLTMILYIRISSSVLPPCGFSEVYSKHMVEVNAKEDKRI